MRIQHPFFVITFTLFLLVLKGIAHCQDIDPADRLVVRLATGLYDFRRASRTEFRQIEFGFSREEDTLQPFAGIISTSTHDTYGYLGLITGVPVYRHVQLLLRVATGIYAHGAGIDLGFPMEFRTEIELAWNWSSDGRLGIGLSHISNGAFADVNPGLELLSLTYSITH